MKRRSLVGTCMATALGLSLPANGAIGEQLQLKEQLVGTWTTVSWEQKKSDGTRLKQFGASPSGIAFFDAGGRYIISVMRSDRARFASNALWQGTAEENKVTAEGTQTYFGIAIHIEGSSFPNWNGTDQKRFVSISRDQLTLTIRLPSAEDVEVVWLKAR
jgi:hypothetical protein